VKKKNAATAAAIATNKTVVCLRLQVSIGQEFINHFIAHLIFTSTGMKGSKQE